MRFISRSVYTTIVCVFMVSGASAQAFSEEPAQKLKPAVPVAKPSDAADDDVVQVPLDTPSQTNSPVVAGETGIL